MDKNHIDTLQDKGITLLKQVIATEFIQTLQMTVLQSIRTIASQLNYSYTELVSTASRWPVGKLISPSLHHNLVRMLHARLTPILGPSIQLLEADVIHKSQYVPQATICHQDVSYVPHAPYAYSIWLPLDSVMPTDGALQFLPGSQTWPIEPAVDFWQPNFVDTIRTSSIWQNQAITIPVKAGDGLLFSSRIWHGSEANTSGKERFAMVFRWQATTTTQNWQIPHPLDNEFGMFNCGKITKTLLSNGLNTIIGKNTLDAPIIIKAWISLLSQKAPLPFPIHYAKAEQALRELNLLNLAFKQFGAGDSVGKIYANLWRQLLKPLQQFLSSV